MVENIITSKLEIQGYENIKQIKDEITKLRAQMKELTSGTEEYKETADKLVQTEYQLKTAMSNTRKDNSALKGSYNDLANQMSALKKVWKETTDEAVRADYGQQINELNTQLKALDATTGNFQRNVGDYKNQLKLAKQELAQLTEGTDAYNKKLAECAEIAHNMKEQQTLIKNSSKDLGDQLANATQIGTGMVAGFSALNAAMGLFGKESKDVQKTMLKVQQSMALVQGLQGMEGMFKKAKELSTALGWVKATVVENTVTTEANTVAEGKNTVATEANALATGKDTAAKGAQATATKGATVAQKGLNAAMKANPLGAVLAIVMALVTGYTLLKDKIDALINPQKAAEKRLREEAAARAKDLDDYMKYNEAKRGSDYKFTKEGQKYELERLNANIASYEKDTDEYRQAVRDKLEYERLYSERVQAQRQKDAEERKAELDNIKSDISQITDDWESMVMNFAATEKEQIYNSNKDRIEAWNNFIKNAMPYYQGKNLLIPSESDYGESLSKLLNVFKGKFVKPLIERTGKDLEDVIGPLTKKSIDTVKEARERFEKGLAKDMLTELYKAELNTISKEETGLKTYLDRQAAEIDNLRNLQLDDMVDEMNVEKEIFEQKNIFYRETIERLQGYIETVEDIYGKDSDIYKEYLVDIRNLQMFYNEEDVKNRTNYYKKISGIALDWSKKETEEIKKDTDERVQTAKREYELYTSSLDNLWFKNGNQPKVYREMMEAVFEVQKEGYEEMIENLEYYLENEKLTASDRVKIEEEMTKAIMELDDLELQHEIDNNNARRESMTNTFNAIKDSIQGTADVMGKWGDFYADIIDSNVKQNKISQKDAEKQYGVVQNIQAAQAIVNTLAASMGAYQSLASIPYVGPALGAAAAATTLAYGYAQVQQIRSTNPYSNSSSVNTGVNAVSTPTIDEYSPNRVTNITGAMETENLANAMRSTPLWVSVTDIDRVQGNVKVKEQETTF